ncbi:hypothetical protein Tco_1245894 [Tanacetum coccineum]
MPRTMGGNDAKAGSSRSKHSRQFETVEEVLLPQVHHEFLLWEGYNNEAKSRYNTTLANLLPRHVYSPCVVNWDILNGMGCDEEIGDILRIKLREDESNEEIFTFVAWIRAFNIKEPIYAELYHEFYSNYKFDEVCADDELQSKKDNQEYWLSISREERLGLSRSHASTIRNPILRVVHKMTTYGLYQRTTGYDKIQKNDLWLLMVEEKRIWYSEGESDLLFGYDYTERALSTSEGRLILRSQPGVPDWEAIERMEYRQSYHWDTYQGVFEHMVRVYSVPLQGAYNPPGYAQP